MLSHFPNQGAPLTEPQSNSEMTHPESGVLFGIAVYTMWGVFPIYFHSLEPSSALEILFQRITWSVVFCALVWLFVRDRRWIRQLLAVPHRLAVLTLAAYILSVNWGLYIYAVSIEKIVETSLGYFINPLVLVVMGVVLLHERLRTLQWVAVGLGAAAVLIIAIDYGRPPWIALGLAFSFAIYGYLKKRIGGHIGALESMTVETMVLVPVAIAGLAWIEFTGRGTFTTDAPWHGLLLMASGPLTAIPLICFAAAARRVPLATMGMLQFIAPTLQLIVGVAIYGEDVPPMRWFGFSLVWIALLLLTVDSVRSSMRRRRAQMPLAPRPAN